jgi:hypothetical protein
VQEKRRLWLGGPCDAYFERSATILSLRCFLNRSIVKLRRAAGSSWRALAGLPESTFQQGRVGTIETGTLSKRVLRNTCSRPSSPQGCPKTLWRRLRADTAMEGSLVALRVAVIKVVIAGRHSVAFRRKLRQTLARLARRKANADSQDGGDVAIVILWACLYYVASQRDRSLPARKKAAFRVPEENFSIADVRNGAGLSRVIRRRRTVILAGSSEISGPASGEE